MLSSTYPLLSGLWPNFQFQAQFLQKRLEQALPSLLTNITEEKKAKTETLYHCILARPNGLLAILDYVNFKRYGTSPNEVYEGLGWGLYQVLDNMSNHPDEDPIGQFVKSAKEILERRFKHAAPRIAVP